MATNKPDYQRARQNGHFNHITPYYIIHETWSRSEAELWFKINNWGHASEELEEQVKRLSYFNLWKALDRYNCQYLKNLHPAKSSVWPGLKFSKGNTVEEFIQNFVLPAFPLSGIQLILRNNRNIARIKGLYHRFF